MNQSSFGNMTITSLFLGLINIFCNEALLLWFVVDDLKFTKSVKPVCANIIWYIINYIMHLSLFSCLFYSPIGLHIEIVATSNLLAKFSTLQDFDWSTGPDILHARKNQISNDGVPEQFIYLR